jgi:hypothetical protein
MGYPGITNISKLPFEVEEIADESMIEKSGAPIWSQTHQFSRANPGT